MQTEPTLHDFVMKLLTEADARQAFDLDPTHALASAGLPDVSPQDVMDAVPLVLDFASSASGGEFGGSFSSGDNGFRSEIHSPFGSGQVNDTLDGAVAHLDGGASGNGVNLNLWSNESGMGGQGIVNSALGDGSFALDGGHASGSGEFQLAGLDTDSLGRGGDLATGTVAGMITQGASSFASVLTEGAGALNSGLGAGVGMIGEHITSGAATAAGMVTDGAHTLSNAIPSMGDLPASVPQLPGLGDLGHLPATPALPDLGHLPINLPDLGSLPQLPALGSLPQLPDLGSLPSLPDVGHLPVSLPQLPDLGSLPSLPDVGHLPAVPGLPALPSLPGASLVQDTVGSVTSHVPVVDDLTHGLTDHLPLGH